MSRRLRHFMRHLPRFAFLFLLLAVGCSGGRWEPRRIDLPFPFEPSDVVWIWSAGKVEKWHAVVVSPDSVSGIPYRMALQCDSCRRSMPRAQVDSMKVGPYQGRGPNALEAAGIVGAALLLEIVICSVVGAKTC
jgi:hypothetical protein